MDFEMRLKKTWEYKQTRSDVNFYKHKTKENKKEHMTGRQCFGEVSSSVQFLKG